MQGHGLWPRPWWITAGLIALLCCGWNEVNTSLWCRGSICTSARRLMGPTLMSFWRPRFRLEYAPLVRVVLFGCAFAERWWSTDCSQRFFFFLSILIARRCGISCGHSWQDSCPHPREAKVAVCFANSLFLGGRKRQNKGEERPLSDWSYTVTLQGPWKWK